MEIVIKQITKGSNYLNVSLIWNYEIQKLLNSEISDTKTIYFTETFFSAVQQVQH